MSENPPTPGSQNPEPLPDAVTESDMKKRDFWTGFVPSLLGNLWLVGFAYTALSLSTPDLSDSTGVLTVGGFSLLISFAINIVVVALVIRNNRRRIAMGILSSYAFVFFMVLVGGICVSSQCF